MGLFKGFFKKQPGGAPFWNIVRGIGDKFTGGAVSALLPPTPKAAPAAPSVLNAGNNIVAKVDAQTTEKKGILQRIKDNWIAIVAGLGATAAAIWFITRKPKKGGYRR